MIARHVEQFEHDIDWGSVECLEKEKRLFPRKILESAHIKANKERYMNLNDGLGVTDVYGKGKWLRRGRERAFKETNKLCLLPAAT